MTRQPAFLCLPAFLAAAVILTGADALAAPSASVEPGEIGSTLYTNDSETRTLTLFNHGDSDLHYTVDYTSIGGSPLYPPLGPKFALHVQPHTLLNTLICRPAAAGGAAPTDVPCSGYLTRGSVGVGYDVYLALGNVTDGEGIAGMRFGIDYDGAPHQGLEVFGWTRCVSGLDFPSDTWPAAGSGNTLTWLLPEDCQNTELAPNGAHAIAGAFYVYAYSEDVLQITPNLTIPVPQLSYADCTGRSREVPETSAGTARFTEGGLTNGFNPCWGTPTPQSPGLPAGATETARETLVPEGGGGPDGFGYRWVDSDDPHGPTFDWFDLQEIGFLVPFGVYSHGVSDPLPIGFQFPFYGNFFDHFRIGRRGGYISFTSGGTVWYGHTIPSTGLPENLVVGRWCDHSSTPIYYRSFGDRMIVQFGDVYQIILERNGTIFFEYNRVTTGSDAWLVGIQNADRTIGLQVSYSPDYPLPNSAVRIRSEPAWMTLSPQSGTVPPQGSASILAELRAGRYSSGTYTADILVGSNDPVNPEITVPVSLEITGAPDLILGSPSLDFGDVFVGYPKTLPLEIRNLGIEDLTVSSITSDGDYTADPASFDLAPTATQVVQVTFLPTTAGTQPSTLILTGNDPNSPQTVDLMGTGLVPPVIAASPDTVVGAALPGGSKVKPLTVCNTGGSDLDLLVSTYEEPPPPPPQAGPKVALHVHSHTQKAALVCRWEEDGGSSPMSTPCSEYVTQAPIGEARDIYLVVAGVGEYEGVMGLSCGIAYDDSPGAGMDILSWTFCGDGLEFPSDTWPGDGSGNRMTWAGCEDVVIPPNGVHAVAGAFYVYAYGNDSFRITENNTLMTGPELAFVQCNGAQVSIPVTAISAVRFSAGGTEPGYNPCTSGVPVYEGTGPGKDQADRRTGYAPRSQGGPDGSGYRWIDSDSQFGPVYDWVDIRDVGTPVPVTGDDRTSDPIPIGFPFPFYGNSFENLRVSTNGWISFTSSSAQYTNQPLPASLGPENLLAVLWDDLEFPGQQAYTYNDGSRMIVQFQDVHGDLGWSTYTMEAILYPDGMILFQYQKVDPADPEYASYTVGIQNGARNDGLTVAFNTVYLHDRMAVRLAAPADWLNVDPATATVPAGGCIDLNLTMDATWLAAGDYTTRILLQSNDPVTPSLPRDVLLHVGAVDVADLDVEPNTLNLGSNGRWLNARVELPPEYAPEDVLPATVRLGGLVAAQPDMTTIGDWNGNGIPDLAFKFDRVDAESHLADGAAVEIRVTGEIEDTICFTGTDVVRIIRPSLSAPNGGEHLRAGTLVRIEWDNPPGWDVTSAAVTYSPDGGETWNLVAQDVPPDGYTWRVPQEPTQQGLISVTVYDDEGILGHDICDATFSVESEVTGGNDPLPTTYALLQNAPNPFSGNSRIRYDLPEEARVRLRIYDVAGRVVRTLEDGWMPAGRHEALWDGKDEGGRPVAGGIYFYRLRAGSFSARRTLSLLR